MAEYSISPQFANLSNLQPLPSLDVTRGATLQFQPLSEIQIQSSQPELIGQSIAGAVSNIAKGALGGITAKWEREEEREREERKYAHELALYGAKEKSENADFFAKEEARFISENSGKPGFDKKLAAFRQAYSGFSDRVPDSQIDKEPESSDTYGDPNLSPEGATFADQELIDKANEVINQVPLPQQKPPTAIPVSTDATVGAPALGSLPSPQIPPQVVTKPLAGVEPAGKPEDLSIPDTAFDTEAEAKNVAFNLNQKLKKAEKDYRVEVTKDSQGFSYVTPVDISKEITSEKREAKKIAIEEERLARERAKEERQAQEAEEKSGKITKANVNQFKMQVDQAAASVREINDLIKLIKDNPNTSVGGWSSLLAKYPGNNAAKMARGMIKTIHSNVAFNALMELKKASPTGGAGLGALTEGEREALASTEGSFDLDNLPSEYILPRLEQIKNARLKLIDIAGKEIENVDPEFEKPKLKYKSSEKEKKAISTDEMVSVISPEGKSGKIPKSQVEAAIAEGYKLK